jgi:hypothetical protein
MVQNALVHALAVLTAAWAGHHPGFGYGLSDNKQPDGAVSASGGVAAWWDHRRLTVWRRGRAPERLGIAETGQRMVDVGRGPDGATWIVYPRCRGSRCSIHGYDLRTHRDQDLHVDGVAAAIWDHRLLTVVQRRRFAPSKTYISTIGEPQSAREVPMAHGDAPLGDPVGVDLRQDRAAVVTWESAAEVRFMALRAGDADDGAPLPVVASGGSGEECTRTIASPALSATALTWLVAVTATYNDCGHHTRVLRRRDEATGALSHSQVVAVSPRQAVVAAGRVITLAPQPHDNGAHDRDACQQGAPEQCQIRLTPPPRWLPGEGK